MDRLTMAKAAAAIRRVKARTSARSFVLPPEGEKGMAKEEKEELDRLVNHSPTNRQDPYSRGRKVK